MGREFPTTEDDFELSLELSIGGCYAQSGTTKSLVRETTTHSDADEGNLQIPRSDFSCDKTQIDAAADDGGEFSDLRRRREMQAMKRKEARLKMEFKKSRGINGGGLVEDREAQHLHGGDERREREVIPEEQSARKREKNSNASVFGENKVSGGDYGQAAAQFLLPVGNCYACPWMVPLWASNVAAGDTDERNSGEEPPENVDRRRSSSAVSNHRSTSQKGGSSSDTCSSFGTHQSYKVGHLEINNSSSQPVEPCQTMVASSSIQPQRQSETSKVVEGSTIHSNLTDTTCSIVEKPSSSHTSNVIDTPPRPASSVIDTPPRCASNADPKISTPSHKCDASAIKMPYVSTTGNGPNGRTITGFLHKYTKAEVSIMCVCHGNFFSPAGFVEHAGGINITHPLRHITVVPSVVL